MLYKKRQPFLSEPQVTIETWQSNSSLGDNFPVIYQVVNSIKLQTVWALFQTDNRQRKWIFQSTEAGWELYQT